MDTTKNIQQENTMDRFLLRQLAFTLLLIFPLLFFGGLSSSNTNLIADQLVYHQLGGDTHNKSQSPKSCDNSSLNSTHTQEQIQEQTTRFLLYMQMASCFTSIFFIPFWGSVSDKYGRHVPFMASFTGAICIHLSYLSVSALNMPLWVLIVGDFLHGVFGKSGSVLIMAASSFISDFMPLGNRTFIMITMDLILLAAKTAGHIGGGYWIRSSGFNPLLLASLSLQLGLIFYSVIVITRVSKTPALQRNISTPMYKSILGYFVKTYKIYMQRRPQYARVFLIFLILVIFLQDFAKHGIDGVNNIYYRGPPLCWNSVMLGVFGGIKTAVHGLIPFIVGVIFIKAGPSLWLIMASLASAVISSIIYGFAQSTTVMFIGLATGSITILITAVSRSVISDLVKPTEQGNCYFYYYKIYIAAFAETLGTFIHYYCKYK